MRVDATLCARKHVTKSRFIRCCGKFEIDAEIILALHGQAKP